MVKDFYEPAEDSLLLLEQVKRYAKGKVLDIGTGSGIQALEAAKNANSVLAIDISPAALRAAKQNAQKQGIMNVRFRRSDLFSDVKGKFDLIIFNPPYLPQDKGGDGKDIQDRAIYGGKQGYETIERFLLEAGIHLEEEGKILLLFSSLTGKKKVEELILGNLFRYQPLSTQHIFFEDLYVYMISKTETLKKLKIIEDLRPLAKGKRGMVYTGRLNSGRSKGKTVAVKVKNPSSASPGRIQIEAQVLSALNKRGIGPKVFEADDNFIVMEYVSGTPILEYLSKSGKPKIKALINMILEQLYILDTLKINKEEMHRPVKHIIVRGNKPIMIDFERAKYSTKAHNITQFCQFLASRDVSAILAKKDIVLDKKEIAALAGEYSRNPSRKNLGKIITALK